MAEASHVDLISSCMRVARLMSPGSTTVLAKDGPYREHQSTEYVHLSRSLITSAHSSGSKQFHCQDGLESEHTQSHFHVFFSPPVQLF